MTKKVILKILRDGKNREKQIRKLETTFRKLISKLQERQKEGKARNYQRKKSKKNFRN